jgi:hypothetical protein
MEIDFKVSEKNHKNSEVKLISIGKVLGWVVTLGDIRQMKRRRMDKVLPHTHTKKPLHQTLARTRHSNAIFFKN